MVQKKIIVIPFLILVLFCRSQIVFNNSNGVLTIDSTFNHKTVDCYDTTMCLIVYADTTALMLQDVFDGGVTAYGKIFLAWQMGYEVRKSSWVSEKWEMNNLNDLRLNPAHSETSLHYYLDIDKNRLEKKYVVLLTKEIK